MKATEITDEEVAVLEANHIECAPGHDGRPPHCVWDDEPWPCLTIRLLDRLREVGTNLHFALKDVARLADEVRVVVEQRRRLASAVGDYINWAAQQPGVMDATEWSVHLGDLMDAHDEATGGSLARRADRDQTFVERAMGLAPDEARRALANAWKVNDRRADVVAELRAEVRALRSGTISLSVEEWGDMVAGLRDDARIPETARRLHDAFARAYREPTFEEQEREQAAVFAGSELDNEDPHRSTALEGEPLTADAGEQSRSNRWEGDDADEIEERAQGDAPPPEDETPFDPYLDGEPFV